MEEIRITCKGSRLVPFGSLKPFQGNLKQITREDIGKLKRRIVALGFSFPFFVWGDFILDGHQRARALEELLTEGYFIGPVPVVDIEAGSVKEAAEKVLALTAQYGKMTDEGLFEFLTAKGLDIADFSGDLVLPDIDIEKFLAGYGPEAGGGGLGDAPAPGSKAETEKFLTCPKCGFKYAK